MSKRSTVEVYFTDRDGVRWRIYEFGHGVNGQPMIPYPVGTMRGTYRGFVATRLDGTQIRRAVMIIKKAEVESARQLSAAGAPGGAGSERRLGSVAWAGVSRSSAGRVIHRIRGAARRKYSGYFSQISMMASLAIAADWPSSFHSGAEPIVALDE